MQCSTARKVLASAKDFSLVFFPPYLPLLDLLVAKRDQVKVWWELNTHSKLWPRIPPLSSSNTLMSWGKTLKKKRNWTRKLHQQWIQPKFLLRFLLYTTCFYCALHSKQKQKRKHSEADYFTQSLFIHYGFAALSFAYNNCDGLPPHPLCLTKVFVEVLFPPSLPLTKQLLAFLTNLDVDGPNKSCQRPSTWATLKRPAKLADYFGYNLTPAPAPAPTPA